MSKEENIETERLQKVEFKQALQNLIMQHSINQIDIAGALVDVAQENVKALTSNWEECPYADGMEDILRSFGAVLELHRRPELADQYIGNKFSRGLVSFLNAVKENLPQALRSFKYVG